MIGPYFFVLSVRSMFGLELKNVIMVFNFLKETNYYTNMYEQLAKSIGEKCR
jgi:hypothetical protein